ncbi:parallel beta-helix domain-containing protein [Sinimarinibacterium flocculans]|uniref:parallel beta-helix domain-containing protein n=1 Tax=Sinimarinibacterium flocculans TaxID=985250 RepID=UPI0035133E7C
MGMQTKAVRWAVVAVTTTLLTACGSSSVPDVTAPGGGGDAGGKTFRICPGATAREEILTAFFDAREGDTIEFCAGTFEMTTGLILNGKRGITVRGAGMDQTILNFRNSDSAEGINAVHADGLVLEGFTVEDTPGNGIRVFRSEYITMRDVRARWRDSEGRDETDEGYEVSPENGAYGLYPVETRHVLMEDCEAHGASDAGIYVGQTSDVLVRNCYATYNVAGFEFENTFRAVFEDNVATKNTGGFLVFDLPDLRQYGAKNIVRRNKSYDNNTDNFAPIGNIVGLTPRGTGMLILATDQLEIHDNEIYDNDTTGIAIVNFGLASPEYPDLRYDFFPEGLYIHHNVFRNNGGNPQEPDPARGEASLLPLLLRIKNLGRSAHIVWDGAEDAPNDCTSIPKDGDGVPLTEPNAHYPHEEQGGRTDERGRPNVTREDQDPECKWNAWKFDDEGELNKPENWLCIAETNEFVSGGSVLGTLTTPFLRANITSSDPATLIVDLLRPASTDLAPHRCELPAHPEPVLGLPYEPDPGSAGARPDPAAVAAACSKGRAGQVNMDAVLHYNCPRLADYGLFTDPADPRSGPSGQGMPFELNSALFSDYAKKYRFLFVPDGTRAVYRDHDDGVTATLDFPVGTVIAKTFSFPVEDDSGAPLSEDIVETRLLIKRQTEEGVNWVGLPYMWKTADDGSRHAELAVAGGNKAVEYDYADPDDEVRTTDGQPVRYRGSVANYGIPAALNCLTCHADENREAGSAPIGPKPRFLNRTNVFADVGEMNQLDYMQMKGLLSGLPGAGVERSPKWNVAGSSGELPESPADVHARMRAYLEVNCAHCHHPQGGGSNSGLYLDAYRRVDQRYGICKKPVAAGRGSGGLQYDIVPGASADSILYFRTASDQPGVRMPPLARTVVHGEAVNLIARWIDEALPELSDQIDNEEVCSGGGGLLGGLSKLEVPAELQPLFATVGLLSPDQRRVIEARPASAD